MGTIINVLAVIVGGCIGLLLRRRFPEKVAHTALKVIGLFTIYVGMSMAIQGKEIILCLVSLAFGAMFGEWIDIEKGIGQFTFWIERRFNLTEKSPARGFIDASLLFCVGSMAIVGSITDGLKGDYSILATKAMMDGITSIPFAAAMGLGVLGSAVSILVYQGGLTLLASELQPFFTQSMVRELSCVGGIIVMGIGINIVGIQKIKVANLIPALALIVLILYVKG